VATADTTLNEVQKTEILILDAFGKLTQTVIPEDKYDIDTFIVMDVAKRCHLDEARIKLSHPGIPVLDSYKKAGYLCYWVSKLKPIVVRDFSIYETDPEKPHYINESFAFHLGCGKINSILKPLSKSISPGSITKDFVETLLYTLKFRVTTGDDLSMLFYFIDKMVPLKEIEIRFGDIINLNTQGQDELKKRLSELLTLPGHSK
jgi:hypothetical protein